LNSVNNNGLPTEEYNQLLIDFDNDAVNLFDRNKNGIVFLVETYEGERNYWFYIVDSKFFFKSFEELKKKHSDKKLELDFRNDIDWNFIKDYPVELYPSN
jgi:phage regulator Rha-like protein